jgi:hypothetical protein
MEDVLGVYQRAYNSKVPVICMDEKPIQLLDEIIERLSAKPLRTDPDTGLIKHGELEKIDYQYERCGVASIFMLKMNEVHLRTACRLALCESFEQTHKRGFCYDG